MYNVLSFDNEAVGFLVLGPCLVRKYRALSIGVRLILILPLPLTISYFPWLVMDLWKLAGIDL